MKKIILLAVLCISYFCSIAQNISTGINVISGVDQDWKVTPVSLSPTYVVPSYPGYWEPTPVAGTLARWISPSPNQGADIPGIYAFERDFTVTPGTQSLNCNFKISDDDSLISLELIPPPTAPAIPLTVVRNPTHYYWLSLPITNVVNCPAPGIWKIRATVHYIDALGGFLLSGKIIQNKRPACDTSCKLTLYAGGVTGGPFACGSTINLNCKTNYDFNPQLVCNGTTGCPTILTNTTFTDATGNTPSWVKPFLTNHGNGSLSIPNNVSGTFTLTYNWGINGTICGTCSYTIVISCLDCKCKKDVVRNYSFINIPTLPASSNISTTPSANWFATSNSPQYYASIPGDTGACDSGFVTMWGNQTVGEQITQTGLTIIAGRQYQIKFAGKFAGATNSSYVQFRFTANTTVNGLYGALAGTTMGVVSPAITSTAAYTTYTLPVWTAPANFSVVNINPENQFTQNDGNYVSWGRIDNVCITDVTPNIAENGTDVSEALSNQITTAKVSASPNPFNNSFRINGLQNKAASLDIVNMQGTTVGHYNSIKEGSSFGSNLSAGTYLLRIIFKDGTSQSLKLIKN